MEVLLLEAPTASDRAAILSALAGFNAAAHDPNASTVALVIQTEGAISGGLWATCLYDWLAIELLIVPEQLRGRGVGADLLGAAERQARKRGCIGAWVDTFSFQARGFYERQGFHVIGKIDDHPIGGARYFMKKRF